jgi:hypothetical protein
MCTACAQHSTEKAKEANRLQLYELHQLDVFVGYSRPQQSRFSITAQHGTQIREHVHQLYVQHIAAEQVVN